jgi:hypothetical protein
MDISLCTHVYINKKDRFMSMLLLICIRDQQGITFSQNLQMSYRETFSSINIYFGQTRERNK